MAPRDPAASLRAVRDPQTGAAELADIASRHPELWADIAAHPAASPAVLESLHALGGEDVRAALARRPAPPPESGERTFPPPAVTQAVATPPSEDNPNHPSRRPMVAAIAAGVALVVIAAWVFGSRFRPGAAPTDRSPSPTVTATPVTFGQTPVAPGPMLQDQFTRLAEQSWPQVSGQLSLATGQPMAYPDCPATMGRLHALLEATEPAGVTPAPLRMTLFDTRETAQSYPSSLAACLTSIGETYALVELMGTPGTADNDGVTLLLGGVQNGAAFSNFYIFVHENVALTRTEATDIALNSPDQIQNYFTNSEVPEFIAAYDLAMAA